MRSPALAPTYRAAAAAAAAAGIPIKQLNLVEDRSDYYKHRHQGEQGGGWVGAAVPGGAGGAGLAQMPAR